jgi:hypothetical protein
MPENSFLRPSNLFEERQVVRPKLIEFRFVGDASGIEDELATALGCKGTDVPPELRPSISACISGTQSADTPDRRHIHEPYFSGKTRLASGSRFRRESKGRLDVTK